MAKPNKTSKNNQRKALLSLIYQPELFDHLEEEESKEFRDFITEEAKARGVDSLELIDHFAENREELLDLLKTSEHKKFIPKLNKIYAPAGTFNIYQRVATQAKLTQKDFEGETGENLIYKKGDLSYFYPA